MRGTLTVLLLALTSATHYRFGVISHKQSSSGSPGQVVFRIQLAFRRSFWTSWREGQIGDIVPSHGKWELGDGTVERNPELRISAFSEQRDWVFLEGEYTHTYADTTQSYYAQFRSCCRISTLENNADQNYISRTLVSFPADRTNESPVSSGLPVVSVQEGTQVCGCRLWCACVILRLLSGFVCGACFRHGQRPGNRGTACRLLSSSRGR